MQRCFFHVGHAKTATTFLQHCMHLNRGRLAAHGLLVPGDFTALGFYDLEALSVQGHAISGNLAPVHELLTRGPGAMVPAMLAALFAGAGDLLLSSELFFYYPEQLAVVVAGARAAGYAPHLIAYLPHQQHAAVSGYLQYVREHGYTDGVVDFLLHDVFMQYLDYERALGNLRDVVGDAPMVVRTFAPAFLRDGDVLADLLWQVGCAVPAAQLVKPAGRSNAGLLLEQYELLRAAALMGRPDAVERLRGVTAERTQAVQARVQAYYWQPAVRELVADRYVARNADWMERFMPEASAGEREYWNQTRPAAAPVALDAGIVHTLRRVAGL